MLPFWLDLNLASRSRTPLRTPWPSHSPIGAAQAEVPRFWARSAPLDDELLGESLDDEHVECNGDEPESELVSDELRRREDEATRLASVSADRLLLACSLVIRESLIECDPSTALCALSLLRLDAPILSVLLPSCVRHGALCALRLLIEPLKAAMGARSSRLAQRAMETLFELLHHPHVDGRRLLPALVRRGLEDETKKCSLSVAPAPALAPLRGAEECIAAQVMRLRLLERLLGGSPSREPLTRRSYSHFHNDPEATLRRSKRTLKLR